MSAWRNIFLPEQNQIAKKTLARANLRTGRDYDYQNGKSILKGYRAVRTVGGDAASVR